MPKILYNGLIMDYKPLTSQELERGYWLLKHRDKIKKIGLVAGIGAVVLIYVSLGFSIVKYVSGSGFEELASKMPSNYDWAAYHKQRAPKDLTIGTVQIISIGNNRYNLVALVQNPNADWLIPNLDYHFVVNGQALEAKTSFINAAENTALIYAAYESNNLVASATLNIDQIHWYRRDIQVPDIKWDVQDVSFQAVSREGTGDEAIVLPANVTWTAQNLSLKNFWQVNWQVILYSGERIVGVQEIVSQDFLSLETRDLRVVWLYNLPRVTEAVVLPHVSWLDTDNFKDIQVDPIDTR